MNFYPQMLYEWVEPWVKINLKKHQLHTICILEKGQIVALFPFCIINKFSLKILKSVPIHFGDFYYKNVNFSEKVLKYLVDYLNKFEFWHLVEFNQINSKSSIGLFLTKLKIFSIKSSDIIFTKTDFNSFDDFLNYIPKKQKKEFNRRIKRLSETGQLNLVVLHSKSDYLNYESLMIELYAKRWNLNYDKRLLNIFKSRNESYGSCLDMGVAKGFLLFHNDVLIGYRLGFIHQNIFTSWKLVYSLNYSKFGIGHILSVLVIKEMIENGIKNINNGVGDYNYKKNGLIAM